MNDETQEAESRKYSNDAIILLFLSSGNVAIFGNDRKLAAIIPSNTTMEDIPRPRVSASRSIFADPRDLPDIDFEL